MPLSPQRICPDWFSDRCASCGTITISGCTSPAMRLMASMMSRMFSLASVSTIAWQKPCPISTSTAILGFSSAAYAMSTIAPAMRSATLSGWLGFTFSIMLFSPCPEQKLHCIVWIILEHLSAVLLYDVVNLVPDEVCTFLVLLTHLHKR